MSTFEGRSSVVRRQLGRRLRRLRETAGKSHEDVATAQIASRTKMWKIENGKGSVKQGDVLALARLYDADPTTTDELVALAEATRGTGYIEEFGTAVPESLGLYADLEAGARAIHHYDSELIWGMLQTDDYARAVIKANRTLSPAMVEQRVTFRMRRQHAFLDRPHPGQLDVVLTEATLNIAVGSPAVMKEQIAHLRTVDERHGVNVRVLPFANGLHVAMQGPFSVLDFDDPDDPTLVYMESPIGGRYIERPDHVAQIRSAYRDVRVQTVPMEEYRDDH